MGRGLGTIQRRILEIIENEEAEGKYVEYINHHKVTYSGWTDVEDLIPYVVNGPNCYDKIDDNNLEHYDPKFIFKEPTETDKQAIWRAIRTLEKRGLIESKKFEISWEERYDRPNHKKHPHIWGNYDLKLGGANRQKAIRLVQPKNGVDSTLNEEAPQ